MFFMTTPKTFRVGDTVDVKINFAAKRLTWRDARTLVIEPDDDRVILHTTIEDNVRVFACTDRDASADEYSVEEYPNGGRGK